MEPELEAIKRLLLDEWDPIGVSGIPEAIDEYDNYAMRVFVMLNSGVDSAAIARFLGEVVTSWMQLPGNSSLDQQIAHKLTAIHENRSAS